MHTLTHDVDSDSMFTNRWTPPLSALNDLTNALNGAFSAKTDFEASGRKNASVAAAITRGKVVSVFLSNVLKNKKRENSGGGAVGILRVNS